MAFDSTPWFIGGGAEHSPEVARLLSHCATRGASGIVGAGDLKVSALGTPGGSVRIASGSCIIPNRFPGVSDQSYVGRVESEFNVAVSPTGSGGGRTDLVVARVYDPQYVGSPPADPLNYEYIRPFVIEGVPATADAAWLKANTNYPAIALARLNIPSGTAAITSAMITSVREVALPRSESVLRTLSLVTGQESRLTVGGYHPNGGQTWPDAAETEWGPIWIPEWAQRVRVVMIWGGVLIPAGNSWGSFWVQIAPFVHPDNRKTQEVEWDSPNSVGSSRDTFIAADDVPIPASLRGTSQVFYPRATRDVGSTALGPLLSNTSTIMLQLEFYETAV